MAIIEGTVVGSEAGFYPTEIGQSLRFNDDDSAYLSWTPASAGNRKTWTFSTWVKRGNIGTTFTLFSTNATSGTYPFNIDIYNDTLFINCGNASSAKYQRQTVALFRDPSSWYHVVVAVDTTQATDTDRIKLYINGVNYSNFTGSGYPPQNFDTAVGLTNQHFIGASLYNGSYTYNAGDGYLAETHFIDGTAYDATAFGEFKNGVWIPKTPDVTYGTNGFYLDYSNGASIGADSSGNGNNWTPTNLASTDVMLDSPTNNFATLNPLAGAVGDSGGRVVFSEGNLKINTSSSNWAHAPTNAKLQAGGKWYWELIGGDNAIYPAFTSDASMNNWENAGLGWDSPFTGDYAWTSNGYIAHNGSQTWATVSSYSTGDVLGLAVDVDAQTLKLYVNGTLTNTLTSIDLEGYWIDTLTIGSVGQTGVYNFGQDSSFAGNKTPQGYTDANGIGDFYYAPPAGYLALCTANLPEPAIGPNSASTSDEHFNTVLYTGNSSTNAITGVGFQPDLIWVKNRSSAISHYLVDGLRGEGQTLTTNSTSAENNYTSLGAPQSISTDGFTVSTDNNAWNLSGNSYVAWNWKANGSGVSNTDGSITSTVSANTDAGFSIVSATCPASGNFTVGHGLSQAPEMVIVKDRDASFYWPVYHASTMTSVRNYLRLEATNAQGTSGGDMWGSALPTSTVVGLSTGNVAAANNDFIAYCFHSVEGFSKFGSYTGNGSTDGPMVYTGFRPAFVMVKRTDSTGHWWVYDSERDTYNELDSQLYANLSNAEYSGTDVNLDFLSNGFKLRDTHSYFNASGGTYIFACFAENPFKYSNAR